MLIVFVDLWHYLFSMPYVRGASGGCFTSYFRTCLRTGDEGCDGVSLKIIDECFYLFVFEDFHPQIGMW